MAKRPHRLSEIKAKQIALAYIETGFNKTQALLKAGYKPSYAKTGLAHKLCEHPRVVAALREIELERQSLRDYNAEIALKELWKRVEYLEQQAKAGQVSAIQAQTAIIKEINEITGLHKQRFVDETAVRELSEAEAAEARRLAAIRLAQQEQQQTAAKPAEKTA